MKKNNIAWARQIVGRFRRKNILVVGDAMLDRYVYGSVTRISPEAPVPVVAVETEKAMPGGAANVARNIIALGGRAVLCALVGRDEAGRVLSERLKESGVDTAGVMAASGVKTVVKTRILAERQQVVRVDWERKLVPDAAMQARICRTILRLASHASAVLIEDYGKGFVTQETLKAARAGAAAAGTATGMDPKENTALDMGGLTVITPNRKEAFMLARMPESPAAEDPSKDEPLKRTAANLFAKWRPHVLIITLGAQGMLVVSEAGRAVHLPTRAREVFDVSGAGDTVIACATLALASGAEPLEAAELANCAAGVVVGKLGTACCSAGELLEFLAEKLGSRGDWAHFPDGRQIRLPPPGAAV